MKQLVAALLLAVLVAPAWAQQAPPNGALADASYEYTTTISVMGQEIVIPSSRAVTRVNRDGRDLWQIIDTAELPAVAGGGVAVDTFEVSAETLLPLRRSSASGGGTLRFDYDGARVSGRIDSQMGTMEVDSTYADVISGDGAAFELFMAGTTLGNDFDQTFTTFSAQTGGTRAVRVHVTGEETITTPAGEFEVYVVEFTPTDDNPAGKATLYLTKAAPHVTVRAESDLGPQMGNAVAVVELQKQQ